jgi:hypothetical protein
MKNEILEEINRMRVLGGILNEAASPTSILPSLIAKITRTSLDDVILKAFEVLEQRGVVAIDKAAKTLTKIDWQRLTDDELKLLFSAKPLRDALEEVATKVGVDITSPAQRMTFKGNFKRIVKGYDDAASSLISSGGSKTTSTASTSWKNRLNNILSSRKTATGAGRYVPTPDDFLDVDFKRSDTDRVAKKYPTAHALVKKYGDYCPCASYSILAPHTVLHRHTGPENRTGENIRIHLPLIIPEGDLFLEASGEEVTWDDIWGFNNQHAHSAYNNTDEWRVIFLIDLNMEHINMTPCPPFDPVIDLSSKPFVRGKYRGII